MVQATTQKVKKFSPRCPQTAVERNAWVELRYDALMAEGKHGHYETMFRVVREAVEAEREACANEAKYYAKHSATARSIVKDIRARSSQAEVA